MAKKKIKEIKLPEMPMSFLPDTRNEAIARLHFHFPEPISHTRAVIAMDEFMKSVSLETAYYWVVNGKPQ
jgi:hypothetical protein